MVQQLIKISSFIIFLCFNSVCVFSQEGYKTDTIIYKNQGNPYLLQAKWLANRADTFLFTRSDIGIKNGDTTKNNQLRSEIIHTVESINDTAIFQTAKIGKEIYERQVCYRNRISQNLRIDNFYTVKYQTDRSGANIKILNCADLQQHLIPDLQDLIDTLTLLKDENLYFFKDYPSKMKDCKAVQSFLTAELTSFHQLFNELVPIRDTLKYQVKATSKTDSKMQISVYFQVSLTEKVNGNKVFDISEDKQKGPTVVESLTTLIADLLKKASDSLGTDEDDSVEITDDKTTIEVDKNNYPVNIRRRNFSVEKTQKDEILDLFEYKIERKKM